MPILNLDQLEHLFKGTRYGHRFRLFVAEMDDPPHTKRELWIVYRAYEHRRRSALLRNIDTDGDWLSSGRPTRKTRQLIADGMPSNSYSELMRAGLKKRRTKSYKELVNAGLSKTRPPELE